VARGGTRPSHFRTTVAAVGVGGSVGRSPMRRSAELSAIMLLQQRAGVGKPTATSAGSVVGESEAASGLGRPQPSAKIDQGRSPRDARFWEDPAGSGRKRESLIGFGAWGVRLCGFCAAGNHRPKGCQRSGREERPGSLALAGRAGRFSRANLCRWWSR